MLLECFAKETDRGNDVILSTGEDTIDKGRYGWNGDTICLTLDLFGEFEKESFMSMTDYTPLYCFSLFEDGSVRVARTQSVDNREITVLCSTAGRRTASGYCFEAMIPWDTIINDTNALGATKGLKRVFTKADVIANGVTHRASVTLMDRFIDPEVGETDSYGRYITVCAKTLDGRDGYKTSGDCISAYGLKLKTSGCEYCAYDYSVCNWVQTDAPGCEHDGIMSNICPKCGRVISTITVQGWSHAYGGWNIVTYYDDTGFVYKYHTCSKCGNSEYYYGYDFPFTDVKINSWYTEGVAWCYHNYYMSGTTDISFEPKTPMTRAMFVTILARMDGADLSGYNYQIYSDVPADKWYTAAVAWSNAHGLSSGIGEGKFGYANSITREEIAVFLHSFSKYKGYVINYRIDLTNFNDAATVHAWAYDAVSWAVKRGITAGVNANTLSPRAVATRAQTALMIKKYVES